MRKTKLKDLEIAEIIRQLLSALCYLHTRGTIHADVKPANIIVQRPKGGAISIKLIDFGISHILRGRSKSTTYDLSGTVGLAHFSEASWLPNTRTASSNVNPMFGRLGLLSIS